MKTKCCSISLVVILLASCQRELSYPEFSPGPPPPPADSVTLVGRVITTNSDKDDNFLWQSTQHYTYDFAGRKSVISFSDSSSQSVSNYTETFSYDTRNRVTSFETTSKNVYFKKAEFFYHANGDLQKAVFHLINGEMLENTFKYSTTNNGKTITLFDTSKIGGRYSGYRPQVVSYTFDPSDRLVRQLEAETGPNKTAPYLLKDTFDYKFSHNGFDVNTMTLNYSYVSNGVHTPVVKDSITFLRDNKGSELYDSYRMIYKNLYWLSFSEYVNNSFASSMVHNAFYPNYIYYFSNALTRIEYVSSVNLPVYTRTTTGDFTNTFDGEGRLVKAVYPKQFANAYGGKQTLEYSYIKMPE
jgi:hypothetical protein